MKGVQAATRNRGFRLPGAGTKRRQMLGRLLSVGLHCSQAMELGLITQARNFHTTIEAFENEYLFDIRRFKVKGIQSLMYVIVGRWTYEGEYIDYLVRRLK